MNYKKKAVLLNFLVIKQKNIKQHNFLLFNNIKIKCKVSSQIYLYLLYALVKCNYTNTIIMNIYI